MLKTILFITIPTVFLGLTIGIHIWSLDCFEQKRLTKLAKQYPDIVEKLREFWILNHKFFHVAKQRKEVENDIEKIYSNIYIQEKLQREFLAQARCDWLPLNEQYQDLLRQEGKLRKEIHDMMQAAGKKSFKLWNLRMNLEESNES